MTLRKLLALSFVALAAGGSVATSTAHASSELHHQLKRYYHADGYIKAIGNVAYRTIYNPDKQTRHKWQGAVRWLIEVRQDAAAKIASLRAPTYPPHYRQWQCIHGFEGSWTDSGAPYWGGLQFGYSEWMTYGYPYTHVTTADQASPLDQMWAAERYYQAGAGFSPWPNTARACGLL
jgi:hypothetical protein